MQDICSRKNTKMPSCSGKLQREAAEHLRYKSLSFPGTLILFFENMIYFYKVTYDNRKREDPNY